MRVFAVVRGRDAKLEAVTEALSDADAETIARWNELKKRVSQAANSRNEIAHSTPVSTSDLNPILSKTSLERPDSILKLSVR